jgi:hypothetical protein
VVHGGVHVQHPDLFTGRPGAWIMNREMSEVTINQNDEPKNQKRPEEDPENRMTGA